MREHRRRFRRHPDALLAGVCARLAQTLGWNVWALRAMAVLGLFIDMLVAGGVYVLLAFVLPLLRPAEAEPEGLSAPELGDRSERIAELERRFRELEREGDR